MPKKYDKDIEYLEIITEENDENIFTDTDDENNEEVIFVDREEILVNLITKFRDYVKNNSLYLCEKLDANKLENFMDEHLI